MTRLYDTMVMFAEILVVGGFKPELAHLMEYPESYYANTEVGAPVVRTLFGIVEGSSASRGFGRFLGVNDVWDFNQHKIHPERIDFAGLRIFLETLAEWEGRRYPSDVEALEIFAREGFDLYFLPNG